VIVKYGLLGLLKLPLLRTLWPNTPCVILIRNPAEVIVSNLEKKSSWLDLLYDGRTTTFGIPPSGVLAVGKGELCAWAIGRMCSEALSALDRNCIVIDYSYLTVQVVIDIAAFFGLTFSPAMQANLSNLLRFDSKKRHELFESDTDAKWRRSTPTIRQGAERWVDAPYRELFQRCFVSDSSHDTTFNDNFTI
jgi:hypothetical protein